MSEKTNVTYLKNEYEYYELVRLSALFSKLVEASRDTEILSIEELENALNLDRDDLKLSHAMFEVRDHGTKVRPKLLKDKYLTFERNYVQDLVENAKHPNNKAALNSLDYLLKLGLQAGCQTLDQLADKIGNPSLKNSVEVNGNKTLVVTFQDMVKSMEGNTLVCLHTRITGRIKRGSDKQKKNCAITVPLTPLRGVGRRPL